LKKILASLSAFLILTNCQTKPIKKQNLNLKFYAIDVENHRLYRAQDNESISLMDTSAGAFIAISYEDLEDLINNCK
jgi:hypothetical protein